MSTTMERLVNLRDQKSQKQADCNNKEGMYCSDLEQRIACLLESEEFFLDGILDWRKSIFKGLVEFEDQDEQFALTQLHASFVGISNLYAEAIRECPSCYNIKGLKELGFLFDRVYKLLSEWQRPSLAVAPGFRTSIPAEAGSEMLSNVRKLLRSQSVNK